MNSFNLRGPNFWSLVYFSFYSPPPPPRYPLIPNGPYSSKLIY